MRFSKFLSLLVLAAACEVSYAQPKGPQPWWPTQPRPMPFVHTLFSNDMVLQRDVAAPVWGWSIPGDKIGISVDGKPAGQVAVAGKDGAWSTKIGPFSAGGPHEIVIAGSQKKATLTNVLFGDVWLCGGQSNMNWPVRLSNNAEEEVKNANHPTIRSFTVNFYPSLVPMKLPPEARWETCTPEFAKNFTGVGYFFAREINQKVKVPIGLLHSSVGATAAEAWTSGDAMRAKMPHDFPQQLDELAKEIADLKSTGDYFADIKNWIDAVDPQSAKLKYASDPNLGTTDWVDVEVPKPWQETPIKDHRGIVWFRQTINVPESWQGKDLSLLLSIINDVDIVWFNGTMIGSKQMPGSTRTYTIDASLVKPGKNLLAVAIMSDPKDVNEGKDDKNVKEPKKIKPASGFCSGPTNMILRPAVNPGKDVIFLKGTWKAKATTKSVDITRPFPQPLVGHYKTFTGLFNGMIAPLTPFAIKGALWYQGEANGPFWLQHRRLLPTLIGDWRSRFEVGDFPFLIVSLANYNPRQTKPVEPGWAEIRESQWRTVRKTPNTGLAVAIDIAEAKEKYDIHPRNKQEVGRRLSLVARNLVYGEKDLVYSGPEFTEMQIEKPKGDKIRLYFKHLGGGLMIKPGETKLTGFVIAGPDRQFVFADAVIDGNTIVVSHPDVPEPKFVRYGWAWNPIVNLYNREGLPAITFRTDE